MLIVLSGMLANCGGDTKTEGGNNQQPAYTVGGVVSGLTGTGLVLQINGSGGLPIVSNGSFTFSSALQSGATYSVTVSSQPTSPNQTCTAGNNAGTITNSNITDVSVVCSTNTNDTILVGSDGSNWNDGNCWSFPAATIDNGAWKASRYQASHSGTISYFRARAGATPTGCTHDSGCWAIYEAGTNSQPGALKAWNCFSSYNWTTTGVGWHTWPVTNTGTDLTVTQGSYYWIVLWSNGTDAVYYGNAGCQSQISAYRGTGNGTCPADIGLDMSSGNPGHAAIQTTATVPPAPADYGVGIQTYVMWGVWTN